MNQEQISKLEESVENLKSKKSKILFLVQDTKGNPKASVSYIYHLAKSLNENGYNSILLYEEPGYTGVSEWLGDEFSNLPHETIKGSPLQISPEDLIVIPELYGYMMPNLSKIPCGKIVLSQAYDNVLETLQPGENWSQFGFLKCITTTNEQKEYVQGIMKHVSYDVLTPFISDEFSPSKLPANPIVSIHTRDQRDTINIIKSFYLKYPQYRWVTFKDMRGLSIKEFSNGLKGSFLSVWVDEVSAYGTYPLESMKSNVPVLGLVPNLLPSWMNEENGFWVNNKTQIVDFIADILQNWLEDSLDDKLFESMSETVKSLPTKEEFYNNSVKLFDEYITTRLSSFENQLSKLQTIEE
jgi:hypothetical protein